MVNSYCFLQWVLFPSKQECRDDTARLSLHCGHCLIVVENLVGREEGRTQLGKREGGRRGGGEDPVREAGGREEGRRGGPS